MGDTLDLYEDMGFRDTDDFLDHLNGAPLRRSKPKGADSYAGRRPLGAAIARGEIAAVRKIIEGAGEWVFSTVNEEDACYDRPLHIAARNSSNPEMLTMLIRAGAQVNRGDPGSDTPLHVAARESSNPEVVTTLIEAGAEVNAKNKDGDTPLHWAARCNENPEMLTTLIRAGAEVNAKEKYLRTPLDQVSSTQPKHVEILLAAGGKRGEDYPEPRLLELSKIQTTPEVIQQVLDLGPDLSATDTLGNTALHLAAQCKENHSTRTKCNMNYDVVVTLIRAGADVNAKDWRGMTPLDHAPLTKPKYGSHNKHHHHQPPGNREALRAAGGKRGKDLP